MTTIYADLKAADWYVGVVTAATELGFVSGRECQTDKKCFDGGATITRAEATKILLELI